jgi:hypothetical protein
MASTAPDGDSLPPTSPAKAIRRGCISGGNLQVRAEIQWLTRTPPFASRSRLKESLSEAARECRENRGQTQFPVTTLPADFVDEAFFPLANLAFLAVKKPIHRPVAKNAKKNCSKGAASPAGAQLSFGLSEGRSACRALALRKNKNLGWWRGPGVSRATAGSRME